VNIDAFFYLLRSQFSYIVADPDLIVSVFAIVFIFEIPLVVLMITGIVRWHFKQRIRVEEYTPSISFIITCYSEGAAIKQTIDTLVEQIYPSKIEIIAVIDGAAQNRETYETALSCQSMYEGRLGRSIRVIPKWQRGGRVSTLNAGLHMAKNELIINVDGDTSFDNDMAYIMAKQFANPNVIASGGALRVRNCKTNLLTRMQSLEYMMSLQGGKTGTTQYGLLNNISGAFGAFRKQLLKRVGAWDTHTAEDLDLTMRLKQYLARYPKSQLAFTPHAVGHTDAPDNIKNFVLQRLRWDGDLAFLYLRKHIKGLSPRLLGWKVFIYTLIYGVLKNTLLPALIVGYFIFTIVIYPVEYVLTILLIAYSIYLSLIFLKFIVYCTLISERKKQDVAFAGWLFIYPIYALLARIVTLFALLNELVRRSHEESGMAPWWVLKKGKRF